MTFSVLICTLVYLSYFFYGMQSITLYLTDLPARYWSGLLFSQVCNPDCLAIRCGGRLLVTAHSLSFTGGIASAS